MKQTLELDSPIMIDGKMVERLDYDAHEITSALYMEACTKAAEAAQQNLRFSMRFRENDYSLHLNLGFMAIIALNPSIDITDLERMKGYDLLSVADIGLLFTARRLEAAYDQNDSAEQSENTPDISTPQLETSNE